MKDNGEGNNISGATVEEGRMTGVRSLDISGFAGGTPLEPERHGLGWPGGSTSPPHSPGRPRLSGCTSQNTCCGSGDR